MVTTLMHTYDTFPAAENARQQLLASGFPAEHIDLTAREDEAGPVQGNFTVGNGHDDYSARLDTSYVPGVNNDETYATDFANPMRRGTYLLVVDAQNEEQQRLAEEILQRFGGIDMETKTGSSRRPPSAPPMR